MMKKEHLSLYIYQRAYQWNKYLKKNPFEVKTRKYGPIMLNCLYTVRHSSWGFMATRRHYQCRGHANMANWHLQRRIFFISEYSRAFTKRDSEPHRWFQSTECKCRLPGSPLLGSQGGARMHLAFTQPGGLRTQPAPGPWTLPPPQLPCLQHSPDLSTCTHWPRICVENLTLIFSELPHSFSLWNEYLSSTFNVYGCYARFHFV